MRLRERLSSRASLGGDAASSSAFSSIAALRRDGPDIAAEHADADANKLAASAARSERIARLRALIEGASERALVPRAAGAERALVPSAAGAGSQPRVLPQPLSAIVGPPSATPFGALHRKERWLEPQHQHGRVAIGGALQADPGALARLALDPTLAELDLSRLLVIDTETTGLAGGSGTVPFLIGLGWFEEGAFKLEQLLLPNFGAERPLLQRLAERLQLASCIVTYNGKSFDWPLLRTRFILNRVACPQLPPHVDLLHCARRVWKRRLPSLRLGELERSVLHFHRDDDIDGSEIPDRYLSYLRGGDARLLAPVLEHNQHDVIALPAVLWRLCAHFVELRPGDDARDQLSYGRLALRAGDLSRAHVFGESAAACGESAEVQCDAFSLCALVARKRSDPHAAAGYWQRALQVAPCALSAARLHLVLARLYERALKDLESACDHARFTSPAEGELAHGRRLQRLRRRLQRNAPEAAAARARAWTNATPAAVPVA